MDELVDIVREQLRIERLLQLGLEAFCSDWASECAAYFRANAQLMAVARAEVPSSEPMRRIFTVRQAESLRIYETFVELGQLAHVIREGDSSAIAQALLITNQNWNHPFLLQEQKQDRQRAVEGEALHAEMTRLMVQLLAPDNRN